MAGATVSSAVQIETSSPGRPEAARHALAGAGGHYLQRPAVSAGTEAPIIGRCVRTARV